MKKFTFPLARVMDFRRMQARLEEVKLESLYAALRALDTREATLIDQRVQSEKALKSAPSVTGRDLETLGKYREAIKAEQIRMDQARAECRKRIEAQLAVLTVKRREVKLLEHLKEQRFEKWEKEMFKQVDQQAEEAYLSKWKIETGGGFLGCACSARTPACRVDTRVYARAVPPSRQGEAEQRFEKREIELLKQVDMED